MRLASVSCAIATGGEPGRSESLNQIVAAVKDARVRNAIAGLLTVAYLPLWRDETLPERRVCMR
jgi:hypothetical protein